MPLIDLTSLNDTDTKQTIQQLCANASTPFGEVAAICIYPQFISLAKEILTSYKLAIKIATVANFPNGLTNVKTVIQEITLALNDGADEIDIVFPYQDLIKGNWQLGATMIAQAKQVCRDKTLKVIIESGELNLPHLIKLASEISINQGADFIKTSTGKVKVNATLKAAEIMLTAIKDSGKSCGFKAAGGIYKVVEAHKYLKLAAQIMGEEWITATNFRFGASALLSDILNTLNDTQNTQLNKIDY